MKNKAALLYRIQVTGELCLQTPLLIGSGVDLENTTDIQILQNKWGQPFIPGTSLAGVLRHLTESWQGSPAKILFGFSETAEKEGLQSTICIDDVLLPEAEICIRDGVSIDEYTGIAKNKAKYDYEVVERGAQGTFRMTWDIRQKIVDDVPQWHQFLDDLIRKMAYGFQLGAMTTKGFGCVALHHPKVGIYDLSQYRDVQAWLLRQPPQKVYELQAKEMLGEQSLVIEGEFVLKTSLLVRRRDVSSADSAENIDVVPQISGKDYLIPGPSVKGVLRHQAIHILRILGKTECALENLMGYAHDDGEKHKSRFFVDEVYISPQNVDAVTQTRNAIDRFTGTTIDSRLFTEKPLWQTDKNVPSVKIRFSITHCQKWEIGLALFLLKDLWTGQVALGGDKAVGRGYLQGCRADIRLQEHGVLRHWTLNGDGSVVQGNAEELETFAAALQDVTEGK